MERQPYWVSIVVALIGFAGAVGAAYIIAGKTFDNKFDNLQKEVRDLRKQRDDLSKQLALASGQLSLISSSARRLEARLEALDKASFPLADTMLGTVHLDRNVMINGHLKAFVATDSSSPLVIATPREGNYGSQGLTVFAGVRNYGGRNGVLITVYPSPDSKFPFPDTVGIELTVLQQGAKSYAPAVLYKGT